MKNLFKALFALLFTVGLLQADPLLQEGNKNGYDIAISSEKSLVVGNNDIFVKLSKDETAITNAKVKIKFYMPEMPGMPYMEYKSKGKPVGNAYKLPVNFSMSGTWQYQLKFKTADDKVHKVRGSVNL
jgi:hypothetical protein